MRFLLNPSSLMIGVALCIAAGLPATAASHQMGTVNVSADHYTYVSWTHFDGPVERLSFIPENDAIDCDHITVNYRDGTSHQVFSGFLLKGQRETISFPGSDDSRLHSVDFACKAKSFDGARISLSAVSEGLYSGSRDADISIDRPANLRTFESASAVP